MVCVVQEEAKRLAAEAAADGLAANLAEVREALEEAVAMEKQAKAKAAADEEQRAPESATALAEAAMAARQAATRDAQEKVEAFSTALKAIEVRRVYLMHRPWGASRVPLVRYTHTHTHAALSLAAALLLPPARSLPTRSLAAL